MTKLPEFNNAIDFPNGVGFSELNILMETAKENTWAKHYENLWLNDRRTLGRVDFAIEEIDKASCDFCANWEEEKMFWKFQDGSILARVPGYCSAIK